MALRKLLYLSLLVASLSAATSFDGPKEMSKAPDWQQRQKALHSVLQQYKLSDPEFRTGVVQLFNRETADPTWGEEAEDDNFNEYYTELSELCKRVAQTYHQQDAWRSLVFSAYNPDSRYGKWLVSQPDTFPFFLEMSRSSNPVEAGQGMEMLAEVLQLCQGSETPYCLQVAKQRNHIVTAIGKLAVSDVDGSGFAIEALGNCGDASDIQLLESRASVVQKETIDPNDKLAVDNQYAILSLIRLATQKIRKHLSAQ